MSDPFASSFFSKDDLFPRTLNGLRLLGWRLLPKGLDIRSLEEWKTQKRGRDEPSLDCYAEIRFGRGKDGADLLLYDGPTLSGNAPLAQEMQAQMIHEFGHAVLPVDKTSLPREGTTGRALRLAFFSLVGDPLRAMLGPGDRERLYYSDQAAETFAAIVQTLVGNDWSRRDTYLNNRRDREETRTTRDGPGPVVPYEPYPNFSIYTPSPIARFYRTEAGRAVARTQFIDAWGLSFDRIAETIGGLPVHFRRHLRAMQIFADAADRLVAARGGGRMDIAMKLWWRGVREEAEAVGTKLPANLYACELATFANRAEAETYFETLQVGFAAASKVRPGDKVLRRVAKRFSKAMNDPTPLPRFVPALKALDVSRTL